jgi:hypothetical protein
VQLNLFLHDHFAALMLPCIGVSAWLRGKLIAKLS